MWEFLSNWSELYGNDEGGSLLSAMSNQLDAAATNMKRFAGDVAQVGRPYPHYPQASFYLISVIDVNLRWQNVL